MSHIRSANTKPEVALRKALWQRGFRYRVNDKRLPGSPDIVLPKHRVVVFVHGCFWHGHKGCKEYTVPKSNTDFWIAKIARNQERDHEVWRQLEAQRWAVIIVWECELKKSCFKTTIGRVADEIIDNGDRFRLHLQERQLAREKRIQDKIRSEARRKFLMEEIKNLDRR